VVSTPQVWDQLYDLFPPRNGSASAGNVTDSLSGADFPVPLGRMLFLHSVGEEEEVSRLLTARRPPDNGRYRTCPDLCLSQARPQQLLREYPASIPGLSLRRQVNAGWLQHGSLMAATSCTFAAVSTTTRLTQAHWPIVDYRPKVFECRARQFAGSVHSICRVGII
jgi:hypothetical protein